MWTQRHHSSFRAAGTQNDDVPSLSQVAASDGTDLWEDTSPRPHPHQSKTFHFGCWGPASTSGLTDGQCIQPVTRCPMGKKGFTSFYWCFHVAWLFICRTVVNIQHYCDGVLLLTQAWAVKWWICPSKWEKTKTLSRTCSAAFGCSVYFIGSLAYANSANSANSANVRCCVAADEVWMCFCWCKNTFAKDCSKCTWPQWWKLNNYVSSSEVVAQRGDPWVGGFQLKPWF